jgi:hypothetical protein
MSLGRAVRGNSSTRWPVVILKMCVRHAAPIANARIKIEMMAACCEIDCHFGSLPAAASPRPRNIARRASQLQQRHDVPADLALRLSTPLSLPPLGSIGSRSRGSIARGKAGGRGGGLSGRKAPQPGPRLRGRGDTAFRIDAGAQRMQRRRLRVIFLRRRPTTAIRWLCASA